MLLNTRNTVCCHFSRRWSDSYDSRAFYVNKTWIYSDKSNIHSNINMLQFSTHHTVMTVLYLDHLLCCSCFLCILFFNSVYQSGLSLLQGCLQSYFFLTAFTLCTIIHPYSISRAVSGNHRACPPSWVTLLLASSHSAAPPPPNPVTYLEKLSAAWAVSARGEGCCRESTGGSERAKEGGRQKTERPVVTMSLFIVATGCAGQPLRCHLLPLASRLARSHVRKIRALLLKVGRQKHGAVGGAFSSAGKMP